MTPANPQNEICTRSKNNFPRVAHRDFIGDAEAVKLASPCNHRGRVGSWGASLGIPILFAQSFTMCQIDFSVMQSPHVRPILVTLRKILPRAIPAALSHSSNCPFTQSGSEPFGRVLPCPPNRQSPSVLRVAVGHQSSGQRLRAASAHTPTATQEVLGPASL